MPSWRRSDAGHADRLRYVGVCWMFVYAEAGYIYVSLWNDEENDSEEIKT